MSQSHLNVIAQFVPLQYGCGSRAVDGGCHAPRRPCEARMRIRIASVDSRGADVAPRRHCQRRERHTFVQQGRCFASERATFFDPFREKKCMRDRMIHARTDECSRRTLAPSVCLFMNVHAHSAPQNRVSMATPTHCANLATMRVGTCMQHATCSNARTCSNVLHHEFECIVKFMQ
jgi:hypothetical protein